MTKPKLNHSRPLYTNFQLQGRAAEISAQISQIKSGIVQPYQESSVDRPFTMLENLPGIMLPLLFKESGPTLISFYKPGCPACSQLHPALEQLSREGLSVRWQSSPPTAYKIPSVRIVEINTQTDIEGYKVTRTPTLLLLHRGKLQEIPVDSLGEGIGDPRKIGVLLRQVLDHNS